MFCHSGAMKRLITGDAVGEGMKVGDGMAVGKEEEEGLPPAGWQPGTEIPSHPT